MAIDNVTAGVFSPPFSDAFVEDDDGEIIPAFKSLQRFLSIISDNNRLRLKLILPESGQLGKLTETGYHDGILGLMQEGKASFSFLPMPLDTQRAPGYFTPVISEDYYYLISFRSKGFKAGSVFSSLGSISSIPVLLAAIGILIVEMATLKRWNRTSLITTIYRSCSTLLLQYLPNPLSWYCFVQMIILMMPMSIFNASFNTQAIIRNTDPKIETLRDIITYDKTPLFIEGLSAYDLFKAQVTRDYRDVFKLAELKGTGQPFQQGPIPSLSVPVSHITYVLPGVVLQIASIATQSVGEIGPDHEIYIAEKPFHSSLTGLLMGNMSTQVRKRINKIALKAIQSGIVKKGVTEIYGDFVMNIGFYQITKFDLYKKDLSEKTMDLDWQPLNWNKFKRIFYIFAVSLIVITIPLIIAISIRIKCIIFMN